MKELNKVEENGFSFLRLVRNGAVSAFVGGSIFFLLAYLEWNIYLVAFSTSVAGWLGGNLMDYGGLLFKKSVSDKLGINLSVEEERSHSELINNK